MKNKFIKGIFKLFLVINYSLFAISLAITFTLLFKPFYYYQIDYLNISETSGYTKEEIKESYDDVINYIVLDKEFKTGKLNYSQEGYDHFKDCKLLFRINFIILGVSLFIIFLKHMYFKNIKLFKHNISFLSSILNIFTFTTLFIISKIISFDKVFDLFHNIFFLGKENWLLDKDTDEIIKILPEEFFMNSAVLILLIVFIISLALIIKEIYQRKKKSI